MQEYALGDYTKVFHGLGIWQKLAWSNVTSEQNKLSLSAGCSCVYTEKQNTRKKNVDEVMHGWEDGISMAYTFVSWK